MWSTLGARDFSSAVSAQRSTRTVKSTAPRQRFFLGASPLVPSAYGRRGVGLRPTPKIPAAREKNPLVPRVRVVKRLNIIDWRSITTQKACKFSIQPCERHRHHWIRPFHNIIYTPYFPCYSLK